MKNQLYNMKFVKKFENFGDQDLGPRFSEEEKTAPVNPPMPDGDSEEDSTDCTVCDSETPENEPENEPERNWNDDTQIKIERFIYFKDFISEKKKQKSETYKESGLKKPHLADRNKNGKIEGWEKAIAKKIEKSLEKDKGEKKGGQEPTKSQKENLPKNLLKAIEAKNKKK